MEYCGFLDMSIEDFINIQEHLLLEQIELMGQSPLGKRIMKGASPGSVEEFRKLVPFTTYEDYAPFIGRGEEGELPYKPYCWAQTSGHGGNPKMVPFAKNSIDWLGKLGMTMILLSSASRRGEVNIDGQVRFLQNVPPRPYLTGIGIMALIEQSDIMTIPSLVEYEKESFEKRIEDGFNMALRTGVDILCSLTSVLLRMGEQFTERSKGLGIRRNMLHPLIMMRLVRAFIRSKKEKRSMLPKDLWPLKGLICYGLDTGIYREKLKYYWGREPLEVYGSTEVGVMATQAWNKKGLTFFPFSCFFEFVPEEEWLKNRADKDYQPSTVLLDEVQPGKNYEVIITSFYGMPFLRYRIGDLVRVVSLDDKETGVNLPQIAFVSRSDDIIDIAGFTRIDEKTLWQAIVNTGIAVVDWTARQEDNPEGHVLHIYLEMKDGTGDTDIKQRIHEELLVLDKDYDNLQNMLGILPLKVTLLPSGSFRRFVEDRRKKGADLTQLKPAHINASAQDMKDLIRFM